MAIVVPGSPSLWHDVPTPPSRSLSIRSIFRRQTNDSDRWTKNSSCSRPDHGPTFLHSQSPATRNHPLPPPRNSPGPLAPTAPGCPSPPTRNPHPLRESCVRSLFGSPSVHGHDAPLQFQLLQQFRCRNLVRTCPRTTPLPLAHALTICSAFHPCCGPSVCLAIHCHFRDHIFDPAPEALLKTTDRQRERAIVSSTGTPLERFTYRRSHSSFAIPRVTPAVGAAHTHSTMTSISRFLFLGSSSSKCSMRLCRSHVLSKVDGSTI